MVVSKRSIVVLSLSLVIFISSTLMDFRAQLNSAIGNFLIIDDDLRPVDVIHVIAGHDFRAEYAIQLYKQGYAKLLFFTGGWCKGHGYFHGEHARQLAIEAGIPPEAVAFDDSNVLSTYDEVLLLKKYLADHQSTYRTIMVVSDPFHMRRAKWTYQQILGRKYKLVMAPVPFAQTPFKQQWWADRASANYVKVEYEKLVFYFFRYQLNIQWLARYDVY